MPRRARDLTPLESSTESEDENINRSPTIEEINVGLSNGKLGLIAFNGKSDVWKYMRKVKDNESGQVLDFVACVLCDKIMNFKKQSGTKYLNWHLSICKPKRNTVNGESGGNVDNIVECNPITSRDKKEMLDSITDWCAKDIRPLAVINGKGFQQFCEKLMDMSKQYDKSQIGQILPNEKTVSRNVSERYSKVLASVLPEILNAIEQGKALFLLVIAIKSNDAYHYQYILF